MVWALIGGFVLIALLDLLPLIRRQKWRAVAAFVCIFAAGLTLGVLTVLHIEVPNILFVWGDLLKWIGLGYAS